MEGIKSREAGDCVKGRRKERRGWRRRECSYGKHKKGVVALVEPSNVSCPSTARISAETLTSEPAELLLPQWTEGGEYQESSSFLDIPCSSLLPGRIIRMTSADAFFLVH